MKFKLGFVLLGLISLSGCVSMSPSQKPSITQQPNQKELNAMLNTAKDNVNKSWVSEDGDTHYSLDTSNTHVNYQGVPCRDFTLVITKSFYRGDTLAGTACRYDGQWTDIKSNDE